MLDLLCAHKKWLGNTRASHLLCASKKTYKMVNCDCKCYCICIFDLSRTQAEKIDAIYMAMEQFKNGRIFSPKYHSATKVFRTPHVVVFANYPPDLSKLSQDRWDIEELH